MPNQNISSAKRRIRMDARAAGPGGHLEPGTVYELEGSKAEPLILGGFATDLDAVDNPSVLAASYQDAPLGEDGLDLAVWAEWRDPGAFARRDKHVLKEHLRKDLDDRWIELRWRQPGTKLDQGFQPIHEEVLRDVLKEDLFKSYWDAGNVLNGTERIIVRVFRGTKQFKTQRGPGRPTRRDEIRLCLKKLMKEEGFASLSQTKQRMRIQNKLCKNDPGKDKGLKKGVVEQVIKERKDILETYTRLMQGEGFASLSEVEKIEGIKIELRKLEKKVPAAAVIQQIVEAREET